MYSKRACQRCPICFESDHGSPASWPTLIELVLKGIRCTADGIILRGNLGRMVVEKFSHTYPGFKRSGERYKTSIRPSTSKVLQELEKRNRDRDAPGDEIRDTNGGCSGDRVERKFSHARCK